MIVNTEPETITKTDDAVKILLVEDNLANIKVMMRAIDTGNFRHSLEILGDQGQVISFLDSCKGNSHARLPDIIVLNMNKSYSKSISAFKNIKNDSRLMNIALLVITDSGDLKSALSAYDMGQTVCVSEPLTKEKLLPVFDQFVSNRSLECEITVESELETPYCQESKEKLSNRTLDPDTRLGRGILTEELPVDESLLKVLLIEDNLADVKLIEKKLTSEFPNQFYIYHRSTLRAAIDFLLTNKVDVVTLDLGLPDVGGLDVFQSLNLVAADLPIVVLTGMDDAELALEAVKLGAQDYLVKDIKRYGEILGRVLKYAIERKKAERQVKESLQLEQDALKEVLNEAPMFVIRLNEQLKIKSCNPVFTKVARMNQSELMGMSITDAISNLDQDKLESVVNSGETYSVLQNETAVIGRNYLSEFYLDIFAWPSQTSEHESKDAILICTDVSERVNLSSQREELIAALAHDIRNPLIGEARILDGIINGALGSLEDSVKSALESIVKSNNSLMLLLSNMVEVYQIEESGASLHFSNLDFSKLVQSVVAEMSYLSFGSNTKVDFLKVDSETHIEGDESALRRVVQNLAYNAFKYSDAGSTINISVSSDDSNSIILRVHNKCPKIEKEEVAHLFDRFTKGKQGRRHSHSSGLGLHLCKKIVEGHGGVIGCNSSEDGTTFVVSIPKSQC